jgi:hypothetical protein
MDKLSKKKKKKREEEMVQGKKAIVLEALGAGHDR